MKLQMNFLFAILTISAEPDPEAESLREQLRENEKLVNNLNKSWEDKLLEAEKVCALLLIYVGLHLAIIFTCIHLRY